MAQAQKKRRKNAFLREESVRRLSRAAFEIFVAKGYHAATIQEIAEQAGLTKGAIFFYFRSKEQLLLHNLAIAETNIVDGLASHLSTVGQNAVDKIIKYFHYGSKQGIERPLELLLMIQTSIQFANSRGAIGKKISELYQRIYAIVGIAVDEGKRRREFNVLLPTRELTSMIVATHDGMMLEWYRRPKKIDGEELVRTVRHVFLDSISKKTEEFSKKRGVSKRKGTKKHGEGLPY